MKKIFLYILLSCFVELNAQQVKLWVVFTDKPKTDFDAAAYFSPKNLARKKLQHLPLYDQQDLPVNENYVKTIASLCDSITYVSRWMNAACVYTDETNIEAIEQLKFVQYIEQPDYELQVCSELTSLADLHRGQTNLLKGQTQRMQGEYFRKAGLTGKGVTIALIDAGFSGYKSNELLNDLRTNGKIKHSWDYTHKSSNVDAGSTHGTAVLSCMAGKMDTVYLGCANDADFLLYRTEKSFNEKFNEEEYWLAAMEEADKHGADVINTSLGYNERRYFRKDMNGRKSLLARAANIAARKGILVVCSAGNEGDINWKIICTPGDADSVLTVGAINPWTGIQASWSSYGPSADKRIKPNVSAYGYVMAAQGSKGIEETLGTSFSSPLVAGFAACVRQKEPELTVMELMHLIEYASDLYPYYDYAHGYGVPQASRIFLWPAPGDNLAPTFEVTTENDTLKVILGKNDFCPAFLPLKNYYVNNEDTTNAFYIEHDGDEYRNSLHFSDSDWSGADVSSLYTREPGYFYYNIAEEGENYLSEYAVLNVRDQVIFRAHKNSTPRTYTFYYKGYTKTIVF